MNKKTPIPILASDQNQLKKWEVAEIVGFAVSADQSKTERKWKES